MAAVFFELKNIFVRNLEKGLAMNLRVWTESLSDIEEDDVRLSFYSLDEGGLTIQSTYFFLSKFGCRSREILMPVDEKELYNKFDAIISYDRDFLRNGPETLKKVLITRGHGTDDDTEFDASYEKMSELMEDKDF